MSGTGTAVRARSAPDVQGTGPAHGDTGGPYRAGGARLQELLDARLAQVLRGGGPRAEAARRAPAPRVAALGGADLLAPGAAASPAGARHSAANVHLTARAVLVGPWGTGGADPTAPAGPKGSGGGCGLCLAMRWQRLRPRLQQEALEGAEPVLPVGAWPILTGHLVEAVWRAYEAAFLDPIPAADAGSGRAADGLPRVTRVDLETLGPWTVRLLPEPLCPACGPGRPGAPTGPTDPAHLSSPVRQLGPRPKTAVDAYRSRGPLEYALPADALVNEVCGALGAAAFTLLDSPTTAPVSGNGLHRAYTGLMDLTWSGQADSFGLSRELAFLEGLERWSGASRRSGAATAVVDSLANLGEAALDPRECGTYAPETYANDPLLEPFTPDRVIPWIPGWSLRDHRTVLVPERLVFYGSGTGSDSFVFECSNGCASGGSLEEAVLFALLELIERDAFLLGWYGGADLTEIDLGPRADPRSRTLIDRAGLQGYDVRVFDNRIDLAVPVATAVAIRRDGGPGALAFASAAGLRPQSAVHGALSEILTYLPALPHQARARRDELLAMAADFGLVRTLPDHSGLFGLPEMSVHAARYTAPAATRPAAEVFARWEEQRPRSLDLLDDIAFCRDELVRAGHDVIVVDQTSSEQARLGLRTVCAIVPGLVPIDFGWYRQRAVRMPRMFTAPARAGLRDRPLERGALHLVPHPFP